MIMSAAKNFICISLHLLYAILFFSAASSWLLFTQVFVRIAGSCQVNLLKTGRIARKTVNANLGLKVSQIITFLLDKCVLLLSFVYMGITKTQNRRPI